LLSPSRKYRNNISIVFFLNLYNSLFTNNPIIRRNELLAVMSINHKQKVMRQKPIHFSLPILRWTLPEEYFTHNYVSGSQVSQPVYRAHYAMGDHVIGVQFSGKVRRDLLFMTASRPALGPSQLPNQELPFFPRG
jgi:hypothetical protein